MVTRRQFIKLVAAAGAGVLMPRVGGAEWAVERGVHAAPAAMGLSDPALQPLFSVQAPNALHPGFRFQPKQGGRYRVVIREAQHATGLVDAAGNPLSTTILGYGYDDGRGVSWPGRTFEVRSGDSQAMVSWYNQLGNRHLLPVDVNLHWAYALHGYDAYSIGQNGVPIVTHLHGGTAISSSTATPSSLIARTPRSWGRSGRSCRAALPPISSTTTTCRPAPSGTTTMPSASPG